MRREWLQVALLAALLDIAACARPPTTDGTTVSTPAASVATVSPANVSSSAAGVGVTPALSTGPVAAPNDYRIGPQDLLKLDVFGVEALSKRSVRVNASGQISLPLIGTVQAGGLTAEQLEADIAARLAKDYLQNPQVSIFIEEFTSQRVTVTGAVKTPNVFPLKGRTTLLQTVAQAGGTTSVANLGAVRILRPEPDGTRKVLEYDLAAIRDGAAPDPEIRGEDVIQVETSTLKETAKEMAEFILPFWPFLMY